MCGRPIAYNFSQPAKDASLDNYRVGKQLNPGLVARRRRWAKVGVVRYQVTSPAPARALATLASVKRRSDNRFR